MSFLSNSVFLLNSNELISSMFQSRPLVRSDGTNISKWWLNPQSAHVQVPCDVFLTAVISSMRLEDPEPVLTIADICWCEYKGAPLPYAEITSPETYPKIRRGDHVLVHRSAGKQEFEIISSEEGRDPLRGSFVVKLPETDN